IRPASVVRVEISKFYYLVDCAPVVAADLFALPQTNGGRTAVLRSHTGSTLDDVDTVFRSDRDPALRNARGAAGFKQIRCTLSRPRPRRNCAMITTRSPRRLSQVQVRFFGELT